MSFVLLFAGTAISASCATETRRVRKKLHQAINSRETEMFDDDDEPKDWEIEEEEPPEKLKRKWDWEERTERKAIPCPKCKKYVPEDSLTCLFCGAKVFRDSGFLGKFLKWLTGK